MVSMRMESLVVSLANPLSHLISFPASSLMSGMSLGELIRKTQISLSSLNVLKLS